MPLLRRLLPVLFLVLATAAAATTLTSESRFCPVCAEPIAVQSPMSTNDAGGQDRDLLRRAHGAQVFMEVVATCGQCGFTGWPADFPADKPRKRRGKASGEDGDLALTREQIQAVEGGALERPEALEGVPFRAEAPYGDLPSWARLDMLAQTVALRGGDAERVADIYLQTAWAVRMGYHPVHLRRDDPSDAQREWLFAKLTEYSDQATELNMFNPADVEVWVGIRLLTGAQRAPGDLRCLSAGYGASLMRSHGEHDALLASFDTLDDCFPAGEWPGKAEAIRESVQLERYYQGLARDGFVAALEQGLPQGEKAAITTYLVGELERRLGDHDAAREHFEAALASSPPEGLDRWIEQQSCLLGQEDPILGLLLCWGDLPPPTPPASHELTPDLEPEPAE